jgi:hypothetical protein
VPDLFDLPAIVSPPISPTLLRKTATKDHSKETAARLGRFVAACC